MTDDLTLRPEYRFEFADGTTRETSDPDFTTAPTVPPDAVEVLAQFGREDPDCNVIMLGMG